MEVYRIAKNKYADDLSGIGSSLVGGRWNSKGRAVIYTASSRALALLEVLVQIPYIPEKDYSIVELEVPDHLQTTSVSSNILPPNWNGLNTSELTKSLGDNWIDNNLSIALKVPSVILPKEFNILINPTNPDFRNVQINAIYPLNVDNRLIKTEHEAAEEAIKHDPIIQSRIEQIQDYQFDIFISHSRDDKDSIVLPILQELNRFKLRNWFDNNEINLGDSLTSKIGEGIRESRFFLAIISKSFVDSNWTMTELQIALNVEISSPDIKKILPVLVYKDETERNYILDKVMMLRDKMYFEWNDNAENLADLVVQELSKE